MTGQQIVVDFSSYISQNGNIFSQWYIGITADINQRLFTEHLVQQTDIWIHSPADTNEVARSVEKYFLDRGCDGDTGGGDFASTYVYAYKKKPKHKTVNVLVWEIK